MKIVKKFFVIFFLIILLSIVYYFIISNNGNKNENSNVTIYDFATNSTSLLNISNSYNNSNTSAYIPSNITYENTYENNTILEYKSNRNPNNVIIQVNEDTLTNTSIVITVTDNNEQCYGWGKSFYIQIYDNENWVDLSPIKPLDFVLIAYNLDSNNQFKQEINFAEYYGELSTGTYRIVKMVYDNNTYIPIYSNTFRVY